jgi:hypothetical protein
MKQNSSGAEEGATDLAAATADAESGTASSGIPLYLQSDLFATVKLRPAQAAAPKAATFHMQQASTATTQQWTPFKEAQDEGKANVLHEQTDPAGSSGPAGVDSIAPLGNGKLKQIACPAPQETIESLTAKV